MSIRRNIGTMPDNFPTVVGSYVFDNPLNIAALPMERAGIKAMRIELFDFLPFHANPSKLVRVQLRITMTGRELRCAAHATTHTYTRTPLIRILLLHCSEIAVDNDLIVCCGNYGKHGVVNLILRYAHNL